MPLGYVQLLHSAFLYPIGLSPGARVGPQRAINVCWVNVGIADRQLVVLSEQVWRVVLWGLHTSQGLSGVDVRLKLTVGRQDGSTELHPPQYILGGKGED